MKSVVSTWITVVAVAFALAIGLASGLFLSQLGGVSNAREPGTTTATVHTTEVQIYLTTNSYTVFTTSTSTTIPYGLFGSVMHLNDSFSIRMPIDTWNYQVIGGSGFLTPGYLQIDFSSTSKIHWQLSEIGVGVTEYSTPNQTSGFVQFPQTQVLGLSTPSTTLFTSPTFVLSIINDNCNSTNCLSHSFQVNATIDYYY